MTKISPQRIALIESRFSELEARMASGQLEGDAFVTASKEYSELEPVAKAAANVRRLRKEIETLQHMSKDSSDPDLHEMAIEELEEVSDQLGQAETALAISLLPKDAADDRPAMLEIRAGTGGDEAALFAGDLYRMYERYAAGQGWKIEPISVSASDVGGFKEVVVAIKGNGVFAKLKYESGVHRVQRVPVTESGGRIHTSAATVAVLPEPADRLVDDEGRGVAMDGTDGAPVAHEVGGVLVRGGGVVLGGEPPVVAVVARLGLGGLVEVRVEVPFADVAGGVAALPEGRRQGVAGVLPREGGVGVALREGDRLEDARPQRGGERLQAGHLEGSHPREGPLLHVADHGQIHGGEGRMGV